MGRADGATADGPAHRCADVRERRGNQGRGVARVRVVYIPPRPARGPILVLCGPMGSGKTSVGTALAHRWGVAIRDTDDDVEANSGRTIADIFLHDGEQHFRDLEHQAVAAALADHEGILALGGGAVLSEDTQAELGAYRDAGGTVVFLDVSIQFAAPRVGLDNSRPLLMGDPQQRWIDIMGARRPVYEAVSSMRILTDGVTPAEAARELERRLRVAAQPAAHHA